MNWQGGFFRSWVTLAAAWPAGVGLHHWISYCRDLSLEIEFAKHSLAAPGEKYPLVPWEIPTLKNAYNTYCMDTSPFVLLGPPLAVLLIGCLIIWCVRGFQKP